MSQQINFYNTKLVKPKDWFSLTTVAIIYALSAGLMLLWYQQLNAEATLKEQARQTAQTQFEQAQKQLTDAMAATQNIVDVKAQEAALKALQEKLDSQEKVIAAFEQTRSGKRMHVADYMAGLSHQTVEKLWLTGFKLDAFKNYVSLTGRAYKTELVPKYIDALSREPVFRGQLFGGLQIKEIEQTNERMGGDAQVANQTATPSANTATPATNNSVPTNTQAVNAASTNSASQAAGTNNTQAASTNGQATAQTLTGQPATTAKPEVIEAKPIKLIEFEIKGLDVVPNMDSSAEDTDKKVGEPAHG